MLFRSNRTSAAWSWLHKYAELREQGLPVNIGSGRLSKLVQPCTIVRRVAEDQVFAAMGNYLWAALGMPLATVDINGQTYWKFKRAALEFLHTRDPSNWVALAFVVARKQGHGLVLKQIGSDGGTPLMVNTLRAGFHMHLGRANLGCGVSHTIWCGVSPLFLFHSHWVWRQPPPLFFPTAIGRGASLPCIFVPQPLGVAPASPLSCSRAESENESMQMMFKLSLNRGRSRLTEDDLKRCCQHLGIARQPSISHSLQALGEHFLPDGAHGPSEAGFWESKFYKCKTPDADLLKDPLVEAVFDDLDPEDKDEFKSLGEARKKMKHKRAVAEVDAAAAAEPPTRRRRVLRRAKAKAKPRAKAKAKAKVHPAPAPVPAAVPPAAAPDPAPVPAPVPAPGPAPAPDLVPAPAAPAAAAPQDHERGPNVFPQLVWEDILCPKCGLASAQKKYHPSPGLRDNASWFFRCLATVSIVVTRV